MKSDGVLRSRLFSDMEHVRHGFSTKRHGDMRDTTNREDFATVVGVDIERMSKPRQIHGTRIRVLSDRTYRPIIDGTDGLVSRFRPLIVISADCAPILAVTESSRMVGVAHAGWRGTLGGIAQNLVDAMTRDGADRSDIRIAIGPRIGMSCYPVPEDRAKQFLDAFGSESGVATKIGSTWHVDIGVANVIRLRESGIPRDHIDLMDVCTSCESDTYFSYRRSDPLSYGEIAGVIGMQV